MKENIILMVVPAAAVVIILLLKDRISDALRRRRNPPEKLAAEIRTRLLQTDWTFYERHLQRPAPAALRELYSDMALIDAWRGITSRTLSHLDKCVEFAPYLKCAIHGNPVLKPMILRNEAKFIKFKC